MSTGIGPSDLTVAISTLDRPAALARCLEAVLSNTIRPSRILVVDQSQDDKSERIVQAAEGRGVPLAYIRQTKRGLSASRNAALAATDTPLLAVTDDDCIPDADWIAALRQAFRVAPAPAVVTGRVLPFGPEQPGRFAVSSRTSERRTDFRGYAPPWMVGTGANFAARSEWLKRVGGFDERLGVGSAGRAGEDLDIIFRLLRAGALARFAPTAIVFHERQERARRLLSRTTYGIGAGACCALWLRQGDLRGLRVLLDWVVLRSSRLVGAIPRQHMMLVYEELLVLAGTVRGILYGLRTRGSATSQLENGLCST